MCNCGYVFACATVFELLHVTVCVCVCVRVRVCVRVLIARLRNSAITVFFRLRARGACEIEK